MSMSFDPLKEALNLANHKISLSRAETMDMDTAVIVEDGRFDYGETRYLAFGPIDGKIFCLVFTIRNGKIRPISLRRANRKEIKRHGLQTEI